MNRYLYFRFPKSVQLWNQVAFSDKLWYDARAMAESFPSLAPYFNAEAYVIFDMTKSLDINHMQDRITKVMSSVFETLPELGGVEKDKAVIAQSKGIIHMLSMAKKRYRMHSFVFQLLIRIVLFSAVTLTVWQSTLDEDSTLYDAFRVANIILPLVGSVLLALDSSYRPAFKFVALLLAEKRIESEIFRYRTRTGIYRPLGRVGTESRKRVRMVFSQKCQDILAECVQSDFSTGTLFQSVYMSQSAKNTGLWSLPAATLKRDRGMFGGGGNDDDVVGAVERGDPGVAAGPDMIPEGAEAQPEQPRSAATARSGSLKKHKSKVVMGPSTVYVPNQKRPGHDKMFYSHQYVFDEKPECPNKQIENIFYSRDYDFRPDANFLKEEQYGLTFCEEIESRLDDDFFGRKNVKVEAVMKASQYIDARLTNCGREFYLELPRLTLMHRIFLFLSISLTAAATGFVSFNLEAWVPVVLAGAAAAEFAGSYLQLDARIPRLNASACELTKVLLWWNGLTLIQCRQPSNKDQLVERTENAILAQYENLAGSTASFAKKFEAAVEEARHPKTSGRQSDDDDVLLSGSTAHQMSLPSFSSLQTKKYS